MTRILGICLLILLAGCDTPVPPVVRCEPGWHEIGTKLMFCSEEGEWLLEVTPPRPEPQEAQGKSSI